MFLATCRKLICFVFLGIYHANILKKLWKKRLQLSAFTFYIVLLSNTDFPTDINWKFLLLTEMSVVIVFIYFFEVDVYYKCNIFVALQSYKSFKTYF